MFAASSFYTGNCTLVECIWNIQHKVLHISKYHDKIMTPNVQESSSLRLKQMEKNRGPAQDMLLHGYCHRLLMLDIAASIFGDVCHKQVNLHWWTSHVWHWFRVTLCMLIYSHLYEIISIWIWGRLTTSHITRIKFACMDQPLPAMFILSRPYSCSLDVDMSFHDKILPSADMPAGRTPFKNTCNLTFPGNTTVLHCTNQ